VNELVALDLPNSQLFVDALQRIWDRGDAAFPIDQRLPTAARAELFAAIGPHRVFGPDGEQRLPEATNRPLMDGTDGLVVATSGSTGVPKGVVLTHDAIQASAELTNEHLKVDPLTDKWYACLPFAHIGGLSVATRALLGGVAFTPTSAIDEASLATAEKEHHTLISLVPAALGRINAARWRTILLGGSAIPQSIPKNAIRTYGMTETGSGVVYDGLPLEGVSVRTVDGVIELRTPTIARCYRSSSGTAALPLSADGWFQTGDAGTIDNGVLQVEGRIGDVIVTGGEKVWPERVENVIRNAPGVTDVGVFGVADPTWGHRVTAAVVASDPAHPPTLGELRDWAKQTLPPYCAPTRLVFVESISRTAIGKIRRTELQRLENDLPR
jgi:o-succinylbenzoate---CoA ligase